MEPLIITATPNNCWLHPEIPYPRTIDEIVEEAKQCEAAGASILHIHAVDWPATIDALRAETDLIVQCGMSSLPIPERMAVFEHRADMISIILSHHDEAFAELDTHALHPREELGAYAELSRRHGVRLELETWHTGSIWNLEWLIERELLEPPYFTSLFFGWPGGSYTPATVDEYLRRRAALPEGCLATVSAMGDGQPLVVAAAIISGDHVRVGTEDRPFGRDGERAPTHELVRQAAELARAYGRAVATPAEARDLAGLAVARTRSRELQREGKR
jgi:3-keto-5-aminohexanoate cleavage enzyme